MKFKLVLFFILFILLFVPFPFYGIETVHYHFVDMNFNYPGNFPTFCFSFIISAVFAYTLYLAGVGFLTAIWVYIATRDKTELKKAILGFLAGLIVGIGIKLLVIYNVL